MTKVITRVCGTLLLICLLAAFQQPVASGAGQETSAASPQSAQISAPESRAAAPNTAEALYFQLSSVGLDKTRVYRVRQVSFNRAAIHIMLDDGTIAFTKDVEGRVTGAFFQGEGEVLVMPPNPVERASMVLFTKAAILEERFGTAYFRFNDNTYEELLPSLAPADNPDEFIADSDETARTLASVDAMRLLLTFSHFLPVAGQGPQDGAPASDDRILHAHVQGRHLGGFDLYFDSTGTEQVRVGQLRTTGGQSYYDVWASFASQAKQGRSGNASIAAGVEGRPDQIKISSYKIRATVKPPTELDADAMLQVEVRRGGERAVAFALSRFLQLEKVEVDGRPAEFIHNPALEGTQLARQGNDVVVVVFPRPLQTGQRIKMRFVYRGEVLSAAGNGLLYVGARGHWYPNRGLNMCNFDLEFHYPAGWTLVATGKRTEEAHSSSPEDGAAASPDETTGEQISRWVSERPMPLAGFNLGRYSHAEAHAGKVLIATYAASGVEDSFPTPPPKAIIPPISPQGRTPLAPVIITTPAPAPRQSQQRISDEAARAVEFFASRFGPYPYEDLALTQMPGALSQGWPGLIFLSSYAFLSPEEAAQLHLNPQSTLRNSGMIAHETAHQWWGDAVTWASYRDQWIMEALAEYSSLMLLESQNPIQFQEVLDGYRDQLLEKNKDGEPLMDAGPVTLGPRLSNSHFPTGYEAISYGRGAWLMHMLHTMLRDAESGSAARGRGAKAGSDDLFIRALRRVQERYRGKAITTRELIQAFTEELPHSLWYEGRKSLDWFMEGWVNGTAIPRLELKDVRYIDQGDSTTVRGTILQSEAPEELVTSVPVYARVRGKNVLLGRVFVDSPETGFQLRAPARTRKVVLDPEGTLLARIH